MASPDPTIGGTVHIVGSITSALTAPVTSLTLTLPDSLTVTSGNLVVNGILVAEEPMKIAVDVTIQQAGNWTIKLKVNNSVGWGQERYIYLVVPETGTGSITDIPPNHGTWNPEATTDFRVEPYSPTPTYNGPTETPRVPYQRPTPQFPALLPSLLITLGNTEGCELPCWQGLRIGESTREDVNRVFADVLNAPGYIPPSVPDDSPAAPLADDFGNADFVGQTWELGERGTETQGGYHLYAYIDRETDQLVGIVEWLGRYGADYPVPTVLDVLNQLGTPSWVFIDGYGLGMNYARGIDVYWYLGPVTGLHGGEICLDSPSHDQIYRLTAPYSRIEDIQVNGLIRAWLEDGLDKSIETQLGMTVNEFMELAYSDHPCYPYIN